MTFDHVFPAREVAFPQTPEPTVQVETRQAPNAPAAASDAEPAGAEQANSEAPADQAPDPTADAARLTQRWQGWVYEPSPGWISSLEKRRSELLKPVDEEAGEQAEGDD